MIQADSSTSQFSNTNFTVMKPTINNLSQYEMNVIFFENNQSLRAEMNYSYLNTENFSLDYLYFNLWPKNIQSTSLGIGNITHDSQKLSYSFSGTNGSFLRVNLNQNVTVGTRYNLTISFNLKLPFTENRFGYALQAKGSDHDVYALTNWYPILAVYENNHFVLQPYSSFGESFYSDMAFYNVSLSTV